MPRGRLPEGDRGPLTPEFVRLLWDRQRGLRAAWEPVLPNHVARRGCGLVRGTVRGDRGRHIAALTR